MEFTMHTAVAIVPFIALAVVGIALLWQHRSIVTVLIALGFCSVAYHWHSCGVLRIWRTRRFRHSHESSWLDPVGDHHWGIVVGLWVGSLSILWHTLVQARARN
jgi:hypothetical protein